MAAWTAEIVPEGVEVGVIDAGVTITRPGFHAVILVGTVMRDAGPRQKALEDALLVFGKSLQKDMSAMVGRAWPDETAEPHYAVTADELHLWWGGPSEGDARVVMPPIHRPDVLRHG